MKWSHIDEAMYRDLYNMTCDKPLSNFNEFDITIGSSDSAEITDLVGVYLLDRKGPVSGRHFTDGKRDEQRPS